MNKWKVVILMMGMLWFAGGLTNAAIYIDGQLYSGNSLNITDSSYQYSYVYLDGDSIVNWYTSPSYDSYWGVDSMTSRGNSTVNIYYEDLIHDVGGNDIYQPGITFNLNVLDSSTINFFMPENDPFSFYLWDGQGNLPANFVDVYMGLQINSINYPSIAAGSDLMRGYGPDIPQVLTPWVGTLQLQNDALMNFIPEPATVFLIAIGGLLIRRK